MELFTLLLFIPACFALNMAPGPNNLLAMNNARQFGVRAAFVAGMGRLAAFVIMIVLAASGLAVVLYTSETLFLLIKIVGACYLFWIAITLWRSNSSPMTNVGNSRLDFFQLARQEFLLAAGNPKAILIFTAFLPQFIDVSANVNEQFLSLGVVFLLLEALAICLYAIVGVYLRHWFSKPAVIARFNKCCASFLALSGVNLLLSRRVSVA